MRKFFKEVDMENREAMIEFLENHFRYNTMNSWNQSTSYANNMKMYAIGLDDEQYSQLLKLSETDEFYRRLRPLTDQWGKEYNYCYQAGWNGRSGGYLVMYNGETKPSQYKSYCENCGKRNFTLATPESCRCGVCGDEARVNYGKAPIEIHTFPGRPIDQYEDFDDWDDDSLRERVELVQSFDKLCDAIVAKALELAKNYRAVERTICIPETVMVMEAVGEV